MFGFESLDVWKLGRRFVSRIYEVSERFPSNERFGLTQHLRKSATSVVSNLAEGSSRFARDDFKRFMQISIGSLYETITQLYIALDNKYVEQNTFNQIYGEAEIIARMISKLAKSRK